MLLACTNEKGEVNVCLFESNDYGMTRVRRRISTVALIENANSGLTLVLTRQLQLAAVQPISIHYDLCSTFHQKAS
jgi:hypothetical protein